MEKPSYFDIASELETTSSILFEDKQALSSAWNDLVKLSQTVKEYPAYAEHALPAIMAGINVIIRELDSLCKRMDAYADSIYQQDEAFMAAHSKKEEVNDRG